MKPFLAGLSVVLATVPLAAHHNFRSEFDASRPFKLSGTVTRVEWFNPHTWFYVDVREITDEGGKPLKAAAVCGVELGEVTP